MENQINSPKVSFNTDVKSAFGLFTSFQVCKVIEKQDWEIVLTIYKPLKLCPYFKMFCKYISFIHNIKKLNKQKIDKTFK